jgi:hypothetical protein
MTSILLYYTHLTKNKEEASEIFSYVIKSLVPFRRSPFQTYTQRVRLVLPIHFPAHKIFIVLDKRKFDYNDLFQ